MGFTPPKIPRARWVLHIQAQVWRTLMSIGMLLHRLAPPRPPHPDWEEIIPATISGKAGVITLHFYVPSDYHRQKEHYANKPAFGSGPIDDAERRGGLLERGKSKVREVGEHIRRRSSSRGRRWGGYPVIINFHGGGFTLGHATDDGRWCGTVVDECHAVVVSVDYRRAPEHPFPTAVDDGVDAVIWVHEHAQELGIDPNKIALSGFSSGGNMAFTVPLRLYDEATGFNREGDDTGLSRASTREGSAHAQATFVDTEASSSHSPQERYRDNPSPSASDTMLIRPEDPPPPLITKPLKSGTHETVTALSRDRHPTLSDIKICAIVPWYPSCDYTRTREQRRGTTKRKDQDLPAIFTDLFDESYLHPPQKVNLDSPYLSPGVAPTDLLVHALPKEVIMHCCEWDMLLAEGLAFKARLDGLGKNVVYKLVEGVPHGWDKAPNPWKPTPGVREHYLHACNELRRIFGKDEALVERQTAQGTSAAPRGSIQVVR